VRAPRPLAPGIKLVRRECVPSFTPRESLFRAAEGDIGSCSRFDFFLLGARFSVAGAGILLTLDVVVDGGGMLDIVRDWVGAARLVGDAPRLIGP
jgi:hypothetical protein